MPLSPPCNRKTTRRTKDLLCKVKSGSMTQQRGVGREGRSERERERGRRWQEGKEEVGREGGEEEGGECCCGDCVLLVDGGKREAEGGKGGGRDGGRVWQ